MNNTIALDVMPCCLVEVRTRFRIKLLASSSASLVSNIIMILRKEALCSSEMWVNFYRTTRHHMLQAFLINKSFYENILGKQQ
jgi:hypothetical protein